jgi:hypothetical protein
MGGLVPGAGLRPADVSCTGLVLITPLVHLLPCSGAGGTAASGRTAEGAQDPASRASAGALVCSPRAGPGRHGQATKPAGATLTAAWLPYRHPFPEAGAVTSPTTAVASARLSASSCVPTSHALPRRCCGRATDAAAAAGSDERHADGGQQRGESNPPRCDQKPARSRVWVATIITPAAAIAACGVSSPMATRIPAPSWSTTVRTAGARPPRSPERAKSSACPRCRRIPGGETPLQPVSGQIEAWDDAGDGQADAQMSSRRSWRVSSRLWQIVIPSSQGPRACR